MKKSIYNSLTFLIIGLFTVALLPSLELWGWGFWQQYDKDNVRLNTILANILAYLIISFILWQFKKFATTNIISFILPTVTIIYLLVFSYFIFTRLGYSRHVLITGYILNLFYFFICHFFEEKYNISTYAVLPTEGLQNFTQQKHIKKINFIILKQPALLNFRINGVIADLHSNSLDKKWEKFLAECTLRHIPVFNIKQIQESLTGRIQVNHLSENHLGSLLPSPLYIFMKRIIDILIVLSTLPITLSLMLIIAIIIKIDSPGSILFVQNRVGQGNRDFSIYKFRSMIMDAEIDGAQLAQDHDQRITRVGMWLRKTRFDEIPQIWNVFKGDMSLIGPRPEQRMFVNQFEENIPFYIYRHVVKPGMTGWAQVMQGYASNETDTIVKVQYDFYYIKHFSFWLDILILLKTIRVILTGVGAK